MIASHSVLCCIHTWGVSKLRAEQNGQHFADNIFKCFSSMKIIIPTVQRSCWGVYWFHSVCPSIRPSVCPSVPHPMSALWCLQFWLDPFYISTSYQVTTGVLHVNFLAKFQNLNFWQFFKFVTLTLSFCEVRRASHCHSPQTTYSSKSTCCTISAQNSAMHVVVYAGRLTSQRSIVEIINW